MLEAFVAGLVIMAVVTGWVLVQEAARAFARRHPEYGPYQEKRGCGGGCSCGAGSCRRD